MKCEGMPTRRLEEKRVEECAGKESERERAIGRRCRYEVCGGGGRERTHAGERVREKALWLLLLYVFFLHLGLPYANWAWPGVLFVLFVLPEVFTLVLGPSLFFSHRHFGRLFPFLPT